MNIVLNWSDWLALFGHFLTLSLLAVGGGFSVVPGMHRFLVTEHGWLSDPQFASSIALAQMAPGPNVLFVALLGWHVGINSGGVLWALLGATLCLVGIVLPSSVLTLFATRWARRNRQRPAVRAFSLGLTPLVVALLASTAWLLLEPNIGADASWRYWLAGVVAVLVVWKTRMHLLWLLLAGAVAGALGWI
ncbi:chromate transporter [Piscinibacter sakaiensis]|uniref:chromate transporter n=1 Tax=Piscinibacter sakaiensis TaxID=1547922 RepID=UPI003AAA803D